MARRLCASCPKQKSKPWPAVRYGSPQPEPRFFWPGARARTRDAMKHASKILGALVPRRPTPIRGKCVRVFSGPPFAVGGPDTPILRDRLSSAVKQCKRSARVCRHALFKLCFCVIVTGAALGCRPQDDPEITVPGLQIDAPDRVFGAEAFPVVVTGASPGETVRLHVFRRSGRAGELSHSVTNFLTPDSGRLSTAVDEPVGFNTPSIRRIFWRRLPVQDREAALSQVRERLEEPDPHWLIIAETSNDTGWSIVEIAAVSADPQVSVEPVTASGMEGWRFAPADRPGSLIILLGGADGGQMFEMAHAIARSGFTAVTLDWRQTMSPGRCLGRLDFDALDAAISSLLDQSHLPSGGFALFGFSHGQVLALLYAARGDRDPSLVAVASGPDYISNGEGGPFCLFSDTALTIGDAPVDQINGWGPGPLALWRFAATRVGWMSQAQANLEAIERTSPERFEAARIPAPSRDVALLAAAGGRDSLAPAVSAANRLCRSPDECLIFPQAEHELLWTGASALGCDWMGEQTCEATGQAQDALLRALVDRMNTVLIEAEASP